MCHFHESEEIVTFGCPEQEYVEVGGRPVRKGPRYLVGRDLLLGEIKPEQILIA